jgi:Dna[CI] antecedent, DciA
LADKYPKRIGELLGGAARGWGMPELIDAGRIEALWRDTVGDDIAAHVTPTSLRDGVLRVRADSPIWATEVGYLRDDIAARINSKLGRSVVVEVRVWTAPGPITQSTPRVPTQARQALATSPSDDPETAFVKARAAWMRRRRMARSRGPRTGESRR